MEFTINFYKDKSGKSPIEAFLSKLATKNKALFAQTIKGLEKLRDKSYHREPLSKYIEPNIWELRVKSKNDILRVFYTFKKK